MKTETPEQAEKRRARGRAAQARYRENHPERCKTDPAKSRASTDKYRAKNVEKVRAASRQWYRDNKTAHREYRAANKEVIACRAARWRKKNPQKSRAATAAYRAAALRATPTWADKAAIDAVYAAAVQAGLEVDHIVPLRGELVSGLHVAGNLQLLTRSANASKGNSHAS